MHVPLAYTIRKMIINEDWNVEIYHVYREANYFVDKLATYGHSLSIGVTFLDRLATFLSFWLERGVGAIWGLPLFASRTRALVHLLLKGQPYDQLFHSLGCGYLPLYLSNIYIYIYYFVRKNYIIICIANIF